MPLYAFIFSLGCNQVLISFSKHKDFVLFFFFNVHSVFTFVFDTQGLMSWWMEEFFLALVPSWTTKAYCKRSIAPWSILFMVLYTKVLLNNSASTAIWVSLVLSPRSQNKFQSCLMALPYEQLLKLDPWSTNVKQEKLKWLWETWEI